MFAHTLKMCSHTTKTRGYIKYNFTFVKSARKSKTTHLIMYNFMLLNSKL